MSGVLSQYMLYFRPKLFPHVSIAIGLRVVWHFAFGFRFSFRPAAVWSIGTNVIITPNICKTRNINREPTKRTKSRLVTSDKFKLWQIYWVLQNYVLDIFYFNTHLSDFVNGIFVCFVSSGVSKTKVQATYFIALRALVSR